ncbi:hypothetical protein L2E82_37049 [Cichorium intybus]|uniref:Uncharacterized protein n=1 Tax=Cichorium intybus TaxID=13427 RepID=A0ACB9ADU9_CICIN|nr:hypothetical protein L2E82_37049 [Cichorium intybus]
MTTVVNVWMGELTKLTDKIRLNKKQQQRPNFFLRSQNESDDQTEEQEESGITLIEATKPASLLLKSPATEDPLSEETVFWLMDRFAPC